MKMPAAMRLAAFIFSITLAFSYTPAINSSLAQTEIKKMVPSVIEITVLYNNVAQDTRLIPAWGMSCLIEGMEKTILFDTGGDGRILLSNMRKLGKDPAKVEAVVLSHIHGDHTGGLSEFLRAAGNVELYIPKSFPDGFRRQAEELGHTTTMIGKPVQIAKDVYSTGEMGDGIKEQALILNTSKGLVVITGCAHPGVVDLVRRAKEVCTGDVYLVMGGFHLMGYSDREVQKIIKELKDLGVKKVGPSHCTGDRPIELFRQVWKENFVELGCGGIFQIKS